MNKCMKKIVSSLVLMMLILFSLSFKVGAYELVNLEKVSGGNVTYRGTSTVVKVPDKYEHSGTDFRGAWVTPFVGDTTAYYDEASWKKEVAEVLEVFDYYNLNAMIFHVRTHNNALYDSDLNPIARWFENANFDVFDPLEYLIDECHKAGIEFHAWMNPYRVTTATSDIETAIRDGQNLGEPLPAVNIANDPANLISGSSGVILNPGLPKVRDFIVDTCMEVAEKYDIDAIHFDDYFYISGAVDSDTFAKYNPQGLSKADWRREQVNLFIEQLHEAISLHNAKNNKAVQIGISPSGIYRNGNGSVESGSNTSGFAHYGDYLYSDTYKWAKEGWIDYLLPQSYWAFEHKTAGYADVMDWWNRAFEGLDCLLYSGIGYYMADSSGNASWYTNMNELTNQLKFLNTLENVDGYSMYSFKYMRWAYEGGTKNSALQVNNAYKAGCFDDVALVPEIETMEPIVLGDIEGLKVNGNTLTFNKNNDAKAYVIYRSKGEITFKETEIVDVIGGATDTIIWQDKDSGTYNYAVCPLSRTNTVGGKAYYSQIENDFNSLTLPESTSTDFAVPSIDGVSWQLKATSYAKINGNMVEINRQVENVTITLNATISINGKILSKEFMVTIIGKGLPSFPLETDTSPTTSLLGTEVTGNGGAVNGDTIQVGYTRCLFLGEGAPSSWRQQYNLSSSNPDVATIDIYGVIKGKSQGKTTIRAEYKSNPNLWGEIEIYVYNQKGTLHTITFKDSDGTVLDTQRVFEKDVIIAPVVIDKYINKVYYDFIGWDKDFSDIKADMEVVAMYKATEMEYIVGDVDNNVVVDTQDVIYLLYHLMFGDSYPVTQVIDYNKDGKVNTDDVTYLLYNVMFGSELYPLV